MYDPSRLFIILIRPPGISPITLLILLLLSHLLVARHFGKCELQNAVYHYYYDLLQIQALAVLGLN